MDNIYQDISLNNNKIFDFRHIDNKALYLGLYKTLPSVVYYEGIDGEKAYHLFAEKYKANIRNTHTYRWFQHNRKKYSFDRTLMVMDNDCMVEFNTDYCEILHQENQPAFIEEMTHLLGGFRERKKSVKQEINLIVRGGEGLELKPMEIKKSKLDLSLLYEDDFAGIDALLCKRLNQNDDKGIVLLHGLPGTGKTTYLRHLIGRIKKRILFLSPGVAGNLTDPVFLQLLIDNPNTVIIIEDAENIIMDRRMNSGSAVSNLLNISDGLLADFLNVQLICTFNSSVTMVDHALMRKGRLIAKYEFGRLSVEKAQALSHHFGFTREITTPMTIAEIRNQNEQAFVPEHIPVIGFRTSEVIAG